MINPRKAPFLRFFLPFAAGLFLGGSIDSPFPGFSIMLVALTLGLGLLGLLKFRYRFRWLFGAWVMLILFLCGYQHIVAHNELRRGDHFSKSDKSIRFVVGTVCDAPSRGKRLKIPIAVEFAGNSRDSMRVSSGKILLFADSNAAAPSYGDRLCVQAQPQLPQRSGNPKSFDYGRYLHFQNIHYVAFVRADSLHVLSGGHGSLVWRGAFYCRARILTLLKRYFPGKDEYAVACALLLGYKDDLSDDMQVAYAETGSMHALAVSGSHVSMLYVGLLVLTSRLKRLFKKNWIETLFILLAIWGFAFLTGATASVLRAAAMFTVYMLGRLLQKEPLAWNIIPATACLLLLYNPYLLFDAGFQLSYAAVCGMIFFYPYLTKLWPEPQSRVKREAYGALMVGVAAQLGTLPLTLYYFHQFPVYFWLAGWVVVFGGALFLWGGSVLLLLDWALPWLAQHLGFLLNGMIWIMNRLVFAIHALPGGVVKGIWLSVEAMILLYVCIFFFGKTLESRRGGWLCMALALLVCLGILQNSFLLPLTSQKKMVFYQASPNKCVDFFDGRKVYSLADSMPAPKIQFAAGENRIWSGMYERDVEAVDSTFIGQNIFRDGPFVQYLGKRLILLDDTAWVRHYTGSYPCDVLLIAHNPDLSMEEILQRFPAKMIVFDASNKVAKVLKWRAACDKAGVQWHDVRSQGACVLGESFFTGS